MQRTSGVRVVHFQRRPIANVNHSVEGYFATIRAALPKEISVRLAVAPFESRGLSRRLLNLLSSRLNVAEVNHVTGDIHYVTYLLPKRRTLLTILDCAFATRSGNVRRMLMRSLWYSIPIARAVLITTISQFVRSELLTLVDVPANKVRVVPVCVSPAFRRSPRTRYRGSPMILLIGTGPNKNVERACEALRGFDCHLVVVGRLSGSQRKALAANCIQYSNYVGVTEAHMVRLYEESDLVLFPSLYEGFGMPIAEAQAVGRPVVTSNVASMPEVAGDAAELVDPRDVESIRSGVARVCHDAGYRRQLVTAGYDNVRRFAPERIASMYAALYEEIAQKASTHGA